MEPESFFDFPSFDFEVMDSEVKDIELNILKKQDQLMEDFTLMNTSARRPHSHAFVINCGHLHLNGTIQHRGSGMGVVATRPLYMGQTLCHAFPFFTPGRVEQRSALGEEPLVLENTSTGERLFQYTHECAHYFSKLLFEEDIADCNLAILDDARLVALTDIGLTPAAHGTKLRCFYGNWTIQ